ncbi:GNAT family N-acetyltransferase [Photobacterium galatheae]|uniref:GCN5 family acetyltransferase n=1 Tax=Photobacterium galatheae TaxID=1654360 RepID=A0A066RUP9_9GAMM|nr:GNAT family N-acetyltransferase [Photobacterium galatheae]KDM91103.1 GCN5 family acetyltransferase [Photobacterium galatheae]MCM0150175.1 N-acetyltransferase [Photobacterium galatheae]
MEIQTGTITHVPAITALLNHYIEHTNARFETEPMTLGNRNNWFAQFQPDSPHQLFVAVENQTVIGFACSQPYRPSLAFAETVEVTIYLHPDAKRQGTGSALMQAILGALASQSVHCVLSGIALPNDASVALHQKFGFTEVGVFQNYARKNGERISSLWMQKLF